MGAQTSANAHPFPNRSIIRKPNAFLAVAFAYQASIPEI